ncbi:hypothetical protein U1Q18_039893 [Sarracenia purpurea var. burkii]
MEVAMILLEQGPLFLAWISSRDSEKGENEKNAVELDLPPLQVVKKMNLVALAGKIGVGGIVDDGGFVEGRWTVAMANGIRVLTPPPLLALHRLRLFFFDVGNPPSLIAS